MGEHCSRGLVLLEQGKFDLALDSFHKELAEAPESAYTIRLISWCLLALGRYREAREWALRAIKLDPANAVGFHILGRILYRRRLTEGLPEDALRALKTSVKLDPRYKDNYFILGEIYVEAAEWRIALKWLMVGLEIDPKNTSCLCLAGWCKLHLHRDSEGMQMLQQSLACDPNFERTHYYLARLAVIKGNLAQARSHMEQASRINPHSELNQDLVCEILKAHSGIYQFVLITFFRLEHAFDCHRVIYVALTAIFVGGALPALGFCPAYSFTVFGILIFSAGLGMYVWLSRTLFMLSHSSARHYLPAHQKYRLGIAVVVLGFVGLISALCAWQYSTESDLTAKIQHAIELERKGDYSSASNELVHIVSGTGLTGRHSMFVAAVSAGVSMQRSSTSDSDFEDRKLFVKSLFQGLLEKVHGLPDTNSQKQAVYNGFVQCLQKIGATEDAKPLRKYCRSENLTGGGT